MCRRARNFLTAATGGTFIYHWVLKVTYLILVHRNKPQQFESQYFLGSSVLLCGD
jgi:hypothetical protein